MITKDDFVKQYVIAHGREITDTVKRTDIVTEAINYKDILDELGLFYDEEQGCDTLQDIANRIEECSEQLGFIEDKI